MSLKESFTAILPAWRERVQRLLKESGEVKVGEVNISQVYGGMRDIKSLVTDISYVDPNEGIRFRGFTIPEVIAKLRGLMLEPVGSAPADAARFFVEETAQWAKVIKDANVKPQ